MVSAPSGAGKTTLCREIVKRNPDCVFSISVTTRPRRNGEQQGRDYYFATPEEFKKRTETGQLAEWAEVHGHHYGTMKSTLQEITGRGDTVILDIDVQGGLQIKAGYPDALMLFILPSSFEVLRERLVRRQTEGQEQIEKRIANAAAEIGQSGAYTYLLINDRLEEAVAEFQAILTAEKCRLTRRRQVIEQFIKFY